MGAVEKGHDGTAFSLVYRLTRSYHSRSNADSCSLDGPIAGCAGAGFARFCISSAVRMPSRSQFCSSVRKYPAGLRGAFSAVCRAVSKNTSRCIPLFCSLRSSRQKLWSNLQFSFSSSSVVRPESAVTAFSSLVCSALLFSALLFSALLCSVDFRYNKSHFPYDKSHFPCGK